MKLSHIGFISGLIFLLAFFLIKIKKWKDNPQHIILLSWFVAPFAILYSSPMNTASHYFPIFVPTTFIVLGVFFGSIIELPISFGIKHIKSDKIKNYSLLIFTILISIIIIYCSIKFTNQHSTQKTDVKVYEDMITKLKISPYVFMNAVHGPLLAVPTDGRIQLYEYAAKKKFEDQIEYLREYTLYDTDFKKTKHYITLKEPNMNMTENITHHYVGVSKEDCQKEIMAKTILEEEYICIVKYKPLIDYSSFRYLFEEPDNWMSFDFNDSDWSNNITFAKWKLPMFIYGAGASEKNTSIRFTIDKIRDDLDIELYVLIPPQDNIVLNMFVNELEIFSIESENHGAFKMRQYNLSTSLKLGKNIVAGKFINADKDFLDFYEISYMASQQ
ncbi:MAG: hypothetical protein KJ583_03715 [Nanoarchaeota archaeon]|nr:hypothetical protein [Nanoarchaeota archaeon]MBU1269978.1 hypothetical protein [Nanoarchaeota archaeon]MBU1604400.1 hypothetical protein [Nanoarchaeota archaeon]